MSAGPAPGATAGPIAADPGLLHHWFSESARKWPDQVAVDVPPGVDRPDRCVLTYAALETWSNSLATGLHPFVPGAGVVAIWLPRNSPRLYAAQLAVLKAGAAYTCLDPSFPDERARGILEDAEPVAMLTDEDGARRAIAVGFEARRLITLGAVPTFDSQPSGAAVPAGQPIRAPWLTSRSLAYLIYTSGTTGRPKGVMIQHGSIANLVAGDVAEFQLTSGDRVAQGSSPAYDSSAEEMWLAFAAGAVVVVMDEETTRLGPDLVPWLRRERITVFCPPPTLLRATGCEHPEAELPELRLLYVGGEPLPRDVADRWAPGRQLVNGYGPTECTVTCLRGTVVAGGPISVGRPVPGAQAWVLNDALTEVGPDVPGELWIGGLGVGQGYWREPDLTAARFLDLPRLGRVYRTGDLARRAVDGTIFHLGRMDSQVKIRGYRIELEEIDSHLAACAGVRVSASRVQNENGNATLVAFVVPEDPARPPTPEDLKAALRTRLPNYMVPAQVGILAELPVTVGGKLNRAALPELTVSATALELERTHPRNPLEVRMAAAFADLLRRPQGVSIHDDFFNDLGGDSLTAAQLVTRLRVDPATAWVAVRDLYETRTVAALAGRSPDPAGVERADPVPAHPTGAQSPPGSLAWPWKATLQQTTWLATKLVLVSAVTYVALFQLLPAAMSGLGLIPLLLLAPPAALLGLVLYTPLAVGYAVGVKRVLIGRYQPQRVPVWGPFYVRNWLVQQAVRLVPWWLIDGTEFRNMALRALGARIGRRVHIHRGVDLGQGGWDLLEIADDVTVSQDVALALVEYEAGQMVFGAITLGPGCTLETHAYVGANARVEAGGYLTARSALPAGRHLPAGQRWDGIPAQPAGPAPEPPMLPNDEAKPRPLISAVRMVLASLLLATALAVPAELVSIGLALLFGLDTVASAAWLLAPSLNLRLFLVSMTAALLPVPAWLVLNAVACRLLGPVRPGVISRWSPAYIRMWLKSGLVNSGSRWLYGTLFWPVWLRLAGMKVGTGCEISSLIDTVPELVTIGERTFCADGVYLGGARIHRGTVTLAPAALGRNNFIGNGAIIPGGTRLPDDVLLGVCTVASAASIHPGTSWFGHPAFELPRREIITIDRRLTHDPSPVRYGVRVFWELLRFGLPAAGALILPLWFALLTKAENSCSPAGLLLVAIPLLNLGAATATTLFAVALKWGLLGRVRPGVHPLWSSWASRWDFVCLTWNLYVPGVVSALEGTPWLVWLLRAVGARVGRGVVLGNGLAGDLPDPDMLRLEDGVTVACLFQAHTFEDRVLKTDYITIRKNATVERNSVLLYGCEIGAGTRVAPNSVVLKQEHLLPGLRYEGVPTRA